MVGQPVEEVTRKDEYLKHSDLEAVMDRIKRDVSDSVKTAMTEAYARMDKEIAAAKGEIRGEFDAKLNQRLESESKARQAEIEAVNTQLKILGEETREKIRNLNSSLDNAAKKVDGLNNKIGTWSNSLDANQRLYEDNRRDIEKQEQRITEKSRALDQVEERQTKVSERVGVLHAAIYGNGTGSPKSLFQRQDDLEKMIEDGFKKFQIQLTPALELARSNATRIDGIEQERKAEKAVWEKRLQSAQEFGKTLVASRWFWVSIIVFLVGAIGAVRPDIADSLFELARQLFNSQ